METRSVVDRSTLRSQMVVAPFLLAILVLNLTSMWHKSQTIDEPEHLRFGRDVLMAPRVEANQQRMPMTAVNALADIAFERVRPNSSPRARLFIARVPTVLLSVVLGWLVFLWSRELWGTAGGVFSLGLYTISPSVLAHSRWITNDLATALFVLASLYSFIKYARSPSWRGLSVCAVLVGLAQASKQSNLLLFPVLIVLWLLARRQTRGSEAVPFSRRLGVGAARLACFAAIVVLVINASYLFKDSFAPVGAYLGSPALNGIAATLTPLSSLPLPVPRAYVDALLIGMDLNRTGLGHGPNYLLGELSQSGWWYYYLVALLFKEPLGEFLLLGLAAGSVALGFTKGRLEDVAFVVLPALLLVFFSASTAQIGIRYLLPIMPLTFVSLGRLAVDWSSQSIRRRAVIALSTAWMTASSLSYYPHYLSYFNELIGRRINMYKVLADSNVDWEQNQYYLEDYVAARPGQRISLRPEQPTTGTVIISLNKLAGVTGLPGRYAWLRRYEPVDQIAYTYLVFEIDDVK